MRYLLTLVEDVAVESADAEEDGRTMAWFEDCGGTRRNCMYQDRKMEQIIAAMRTRFSMVIAPCQLLMAQMDGT